MNTGGSTYAAIFSPNFIDPTGMYAEAGHFWTTYIVAVAAGIPKSNAFRLAYYSQIPDVVAHCDAMGHTDTVIPNENATRAIVNEEWGNLVHTGGHMLLGAINTEQVNTIRENMKNYSTSAINEMNVSEFMMMRAGFALHAFADTYAHTRKGVREPFVTPSGVRWANNPEGERGYYPGWGHMDESKEDLGRETDYINYSGDTFQNQKYKRYVESLYDAMGGKNFEGNMGIKTLLNFSATLPDGHLIQAQKMSAFAKVIFGYTFKFDPLKPEKNIPVGLIRPTREQAASFFGAQKIAATKGLE